MKYRIEIPVYIALIVSLFGLSSCAEDAAEQQFGIDRNRIEMGPDGGYEPLTVTTSGRWTAMTDASWVKLSPSNGTGATRCRIEIDSTVLANESRSAIVQIVTEQQTKPLAFRIEQAGYPKFIRVEKQPGQLPNFADLDDRKFEVEVTTNVPFEVEFDKDKPWVACNEIDFDAIFDRGACPRRITLEFEWENNTRPEEREIEVQFAVDKTEGDLDRHDVLLVRQQAAEKIEPGIRGDSLTLLAIQRAIGSKGFDPSERMANWTGVVLWEKTDEDVDPANIGRVRSVVFQSAHTEEAIPYEVQFLTAVETISFYSNVNSIFKKLETGPYICELTQLKNLQIFGFGLTKLDENFVKLKNLEQLDLSGNNFDQIPAILTPENFPNLKQLSLATNRSQFVMDMHTTVIPQEDWGGLWRSTPNKYSMRDLERLLAWEKLEYLSLSHNYMQHGLPTMIGKTRSKWQAGDKYRLYWDSKIKDFVYHEIPAALVGKPKVLPNATYFALNLNYFTGALPDWILFHPQLLFWNPDILVFNQEPMRFDKQGVRTGFTNVPQTLDAYYAMYPEQKEIDEEGIPQTQVASESSAVSKFSVNRPSPWSNQ